MVSIEPVSTVCLAGVCAKIGEEPAFKRAFPLVGYTAFQNSVLAAYEIKSEGEIRGYFLQIKPSRGFKHYGDRESLLMIYPAFQRAGLGATAMRLLKCIEGKTFFVSAKSNLASSNFFRKQAGMRLLDETSRYVVYSRL